MAALLQIEVDPLRGPCRAAGDRGGMAGGSGRQEPNRDPVPQESFNADTYHQAGLPNLAMSALDTAFALLVPVALPDFAPGTVWEGSGLMPLDEVPGGQRTGDRSVRSRCDQRGNARSVASARRRRGGLRS